MSSVINLAGTNADFEDMAEWITQLGPGACLVYACLCVREYLLKFQPHLAEKPVMKDLDAIVLFIASQSNNWLVLGSKALVSTFKDWGCTRSSHSG